MKEIVVAGYTGDLSWLSKIKKIKKTVYRKGNKTNESEILLIKM
jgi:hypothetical protein